ncbi:MAG TPA: hypothetical protein VGN88_06485 [Phycisphaerae bacterium]|jgi:uncharacterized lipoprotein
MVKRPGLVVAMIAAAGVLNACASHLVPIRPIRQVDEWVPDAAATSTAPATEAATAPATATTAAVSETAPATTAAATETAATATTQPGHMVSRMVDPNQTTKFIYDAGYDNVWQQATLLLSKTGFALDRQDYRLGVLTTLPLPSSQFIEFWKPQQTNIVNAMENTVNDQRRRVRISISKVEGKPEFYEIAVQVLVERETNPSEVIGGPVFVEGSGFGRNAITLRSDYAAPKDEPGDWVPVGRDPDLERKLLDQLFKRI